MDPNAVLLGGTATSTVGTRSVLWEATDGAGKTATAFATYQGVYGFSGFTAPIDGGGVVNVAKAGQTILLR